MLSCFFFSQLHVAITPLPPPPPPDPGFWGFLLSKVTGWPYPKEVETCRNDNRLKLCPQVILLWKRKYSPVGLISLMDGALCLVITKVRSAIPGQAWILWGSFLGAQAVYSTARISTTFLSLFTVQNIIYTYFQKRLSERLGNGNCRKKTVRPKGSVGFEYWW